MIVLEAGLPYDTVRVYFLGWSLLKNFIAFGFLLAPSGPVHLQHAGLDGLIQQGSSYFLWLCNTMVMHIETLYRITMGHVNTTKENKHSSLKAFNLIV